MFNEIVLNVVEYPKDILEQIRECMNEEMFHTSTVLSCCHLFSFKTG